MMDGLDAITERLCRDILPISAGIAVADIRTSSDVTWGPAQADGNFLEWMHRNSLFLAEIESLNLWAQLGSKLYPGDDHDKPPESTPEQEKGVDGAVMTSLNEEERDGRILLYLFGKEDRLAKILPSRFDVRRLAQLEEQTRTSGFPILRHYMINFAFEKVELKTVREPSPSEKHDIAVARHNAAVSTEALARKFALPYAERNN